MYITLCYICTSPCAIYICTSPCATYVHHPVLYFVRRNSCKHRALLMKFLVVEIRRRKRRKNKYISHNTPSEFYLQHLASCVCMCVSWCMCVWVLLYNLYTALQLSPMVVLMREWWWVPVLLGVGGLLVLGYTRRRPNSALAKLLSRRQWRNPSHEGLQ